MPRIVGVNVPDGEKVDLALTRIYGIGQSNVHLVLEKSKVGASKRAKDLTEEEIASLNQVLGEMKVEGDLREEIRNDIERLKQIGTYRGRRHNANLPARGQRTRTNARTKRGSRQTVGALKKEVFTKLEEQTKKEEKK
ncbi:MAG: 30S ribosomal protein S13 [Candidatus Shapirobacteria bacterium]|nr:30S ribosomal protein S13 [Candidatus Shapirobacteria bacterium]MDD5073910.1 30S ribosomal protein S13 [Candidatus Shapirobacteria bacterium]MDD5481574.1 30S ribosomal protein S13 [Candidatus Shapirobacteria bacterium]